MKIMVWTDGSYNRHNNKGSWAWVIRSKEHDIYFEESGLIEEEHRSNNRSELLAIINALNWIDSKVGCLDKLNITIHSDSEYCVKGINEWSHNWKARFFQGVKNPDLWKEFYSIVYGRHYGSIEFKWVRGHDGTPENERCDALCGLLTSTRRSNALRRFNETKLV